MKCRINRQGSGGIFNYGPRTIVRRFLCHTKIITGCKQIGSKYFPAEFDMRVPSCFHNESGIYVYRVEGFTCKNRFGADRTIFLTHDAGSVHRPGETATPIDKGGSDSNRSFIGIRFFTESFIDGNRSDGRGRAQISAGNTFQLTTARTDPKVEQKGPQTFQPTLESRRMDDICRTDPLTLTTFNAP